MGKGEGYWVIRTYEAGAVGEKTKFWVPGTRPTKSSRRVRSELKKQEQNEWSAEKTVARLINENFREGDLLMGLDYAPAGMERLYRRLEDLGHDPNKLDEGELADLIREAAERELRLCLRRVKRALGKDEVEIRYLAVTSDMDGDTGEAVRIHHHLVVTGGAKVKATFLEKWKDLGGVSWSTLSAQEDYTPVAAYLMRQVRRVPDAKKYIPSRNLVRPQPKDRAAVSESELRAPKGCTLVHRNEFKPGRPQYIRYILPEEKRRGARSSPDARRLI